MAKAKSAPAFSEAEMCDAFIADVRKAGGWTVYPEACGYDILLSRDCDGLQIAIEAKLMLGPQVVCQILPGRDPAYRTLIGPNHRAVLVPWSKCGLYLPEICHHLGITVIRMAMGGEADPVHQSARIRFSPELPHPNLAFHNARSWTEWGPVERIKLPDYVPDGRAGEPAPSTLTPWKIRAIKLAILLEDRPVSRADLKHLELSPTLWLDPHRGWLKITPEGYVWRDGYKRDYAQEHPRNYEEIKADREKWAPKALPTGGVIYPHLTQDVLL